MDSSPRLGLAELGPPPGLSPAPKEKMATRKLSMNSNKRDTDVSSENPKFRKGSSVAVDSERRTTPIGEVFASSPRSSRLFLPSPPKIGKPSFLKKDVEIEEAKRGPRPPGADFNPTFKGDDGSDDFEDDKKGPRPPSLPLVVKPHKLAQRHFFSLGLDDESDPNFNPDEVQDIDYEEEFRKINELPFWERVWAKRIPGRILIGCIGVLMIWFTSLAFVKFVVEDLIFPAPSFSEVENGIDFFINYTDEQRFVHTVCASDQYDTCTELYDDDNTAELNTVTTNLQANENDLNIYGAARFASKQHLNNTLQTLVYLATQGVQIADVLYSSVSLSECPRVKSYVVGQVSASAAAGTYEDFDSSVNDALEALIDQTRARANYTNTFWAEKDAELADLNAQLSALYANRSASIMAQLQASFESLQSCVSGVTCGNDGALSYISLLNRSSDSVNNDTAGMDDTYNSTDTDVSAYMVKYNELLAAVEKYNDGTPVFHIPTSFSSPASQPTIAMDEFFGETTDNILNSADSVFDDYAAQLQQTQNNVAQSATDFSNSASQFTIDSIAAYNPPTLNPTALDQYNTDAQQRSQSFQNALNGLVGGQSTDDSFVAPAEKQSNFTQLIQQVVTQFPDRQLDFFSYPASVFNDISVNFDFAVSTAVWLDVVYRIAHTLLTINKYWNLSKVGKPPGDARIAELAGKKFGLKKSSNEKMIERVTHPAVINGVAILFVVILVTLGWKIYKPFYDEFVDGCVHHNAQDIIDNKTNGTMLFRNAYTAAFNYAVEPGDKTSTTAVDSLNVQREIDCQNNFQNSAQTYDNQVNLYNAIVDDYDNTLSFKAELDKCINYELVDERVDETDTSIPSVVTEMSDASFNVDMVELVYAVYNCSHIPVCDVVCVDPAEDPFLTVTHTEACTAEEWFHATVLSFVLVLITYVLLHIFRKTFMTALVRIFWREVNPFDFNVLASCTRDGQHLDPAAVTHDGSTFQDTVAKAVHDAILKWENQSKLYMFYALMLNFPWVFAAAYLGRAFH